MIQNKINDEYIHTQIVDLTTEMISLLTKGLMKVNSLSKRGTALMT